MPLATNPPLSRTSEPAVATATDIPAFLQTPLAGCSAVLSDLDGCLISGGTVLAGARDLVARAGRRLWVVSNNSSDTAQSLSEKLHGLGLAIAADRILLAGEISVRSMARERPGGRIAMFASDVLTTLAVELGLDPCRGERGDLPSFALLTRDLSFDMRDLERLMRLASCGVEVRLANPDPIHPAADGVPVPETGAIFAALRTGLPRLEAETLGKPSPVLLELALSQAGIPAADAVFIGDTDATDGAAARAAGIPFVLLRRPDGSPALSKRNETR